MNSKKCDRIRRAARTRRKIRELKVPRLCVYRTPKHIYAQLTVDGGATVITAASTLDKEVKTQVETSGNINAAKVVGDIIAQRVIKTGIKRVAFDRSGFKFHGRVKALADAARAAGLEF